MPRRAQTAKARPKRPQGGLSSARSPQKANRGEYDNVRSSARQPSARKRSYSNGNTPFQPLDQRGQYASRSPTRRTGSPRSAASNQYAAADVPAAGSGDILQNLKKDEREICLLMVDMLSGQTPVMAARIIASLHQRLDVRRYTQMYGGTYNASSDGYLNVDLDGRKELLVQLTTQRQVFAEKEAQQTAEREARESRRSDWVRTNSKRHNNATGTANGSRAPRAPPRKAKNNSPLKRHSARRISEDVPEFYELSTANYSDDATSSKSTSTRSSTAGSPYKSNVESQHTSVNAQRPPPAPTSSSPYKNNQRNNANDEFNNNSNNNNNYVLSSAPVEQQPEPLEIDREEEQTAEAYPSSFGRPPLDVPAVPVPPSSTLDWLGLTNPGGAKEEAVPAAPAVTSQPDPSNSDDEDENAGYGDAEDDEDEIEDDIAEDVVEEEEESAQQANSNAFAPPVPVVSGTADLFGGGKLPWEDI